MEQQRSLGKAPAVSSACHLPGARPSQQNGTNGTAQHDLVAPGARPTAETFQRNSQGGFMHLLSLLGLKTELLPWYPCMLTLCQLPCDFAVVVIQRFQPCAQHRKPCAPPYFAALNLALVT